MAKHKTFTVNTNVKVYFCDPHSSWQRGTIENTNRLLRPYLPKRADLSDYAQSDLDKIALRLNQRREKPYVSRLPRVNFTQVLRRPVEPARVTGHALL
jgi:IS30 family transposase